MVNNTKSKAQYYIGLMSGTSLDGLDVCIVKFSGRGIKTLYGHTFSLPDSMPEEILAICQGQQLTLPQLGELDHKIGRFHAACVNQALQQANLTSAAIIAIGSHGQTIFHQHSGKHPFTLQIGDANIIAASTGITTVADFRRMDMAYGGQGAPLVPAFHQAIFSHPTTAKVVLNIGGIANITVLRPNQPTLGYDTGRGNMLLNAWIADQQGQPYDDNGHWAAQGKLIPSLLEDLLSESYFTLAAPKSTGRELFNLAWLQKKLQPDFKSVDVQHTLLHLTAKSIADQIKRFPEVKQVLVCGGGVHNSALLKALTLSLPNQAVNSTSDVNMDPDYVEAIAFAWLAKQRIEQKTANLPVVTGAASLAFLGAIYQPSAII